MRRFTTTQMVISNIIIALVCFAIGGMVNDMLRKEPAPTVCRTVYPNSCIERQRDTELPTPKRGFVPVEA